MRRALVGLAVVVSVAACGAYSFPGAQTSPSPSPGFGFDVTATEKDRAVAMHVGQKLEVVLHGNASLNWQQIRSSNEEVLAPIADPAALAVKGVTLAAFKAIAAGQVTVTAVGTPVCPSGAACPMFAVLYSLRVTITP